MLSFEQNGFCVEIHNEEQMLHYRNYNGSTVTRFIKKPFVKLKILGEDYSFKAFEVISFIRSVLTTFFEVKMGKHSFDIKLRTLTGSYRDDDDTGSYEEYLEAMKEEKDGEMVLAFYTNYNHECQAGTLCLNYQACKQLDMVLGKAFQYLSPDDLLSEIDIKNKIEKHKWEALGEKQQHSKIHILKDPNTNASLKEELLKEIPEYVLEEIGYVVHQHTKSTTKKIK